MRKPKRILATVDGSPASLHALRESIRLAQWAKGGVTVITVAPSYEGDLSLVGVRDIKAVLQGQCEEILNAALEVAEEENTNIRIICEEGKTCEKIIERSETENVDTIVLGNAGRRRFIELFTGGVLTGVSRSSRRDVLVIPQGKSLACTKILLAIDHADTAAVAEQAIELASSFGAELIVLFVLAGLLSSDGMMSDRSNPSIESGLGAIEQVRSAATLRGLNIESLIRKGSLRRTISRVAREQNADLIVLAPGAERWLHRLAGPCIAETIVRRSQCAVLVVKNRKPLDFAHAPAIPPGAYSRTTLDEIGPRANRAH